MLKRFIFMPDDKWSVYCQSDLFITANEALHSSLTDEVTDLSPLPVLGSKSVTGR
jgi:hypothetical protein